MSDEYAKQEVSDFDYGIAEYAHHDHEERCARFLERNIVIPRSELPEVTFSESGNGFVTTLAQERYQPQLKVGEGEVNTGEWSMKIAYANLAIAEALAHGSAIKRREELARKFGRCPYSGLLSSTKNAIDWIIRLEQAAK